MFVTSLNDLLNFAGEEVLSHWDIYRSGPYGNVGGRHGEFFTDFRQSLDGKQVPIPDDHWKQKASPFQTLNNTTFAN